MIAGLGHEVSVRGAGEGEVGAPHDEVVGVEPVAGLGNVRLVAEHLRGGGREVRVPVVEGEHVAAHELQVARARAVGNHRHGGNNGETSDAIRAEILDGRGVRGSHNLHRFLPGGADHAALAAGGLVGAGSGRVGDHLVPRFHRIATALFRGAVGIQQGATHIGMTDAGGRVLIPGEGGAARTTARLVLGHVRARGRVVDLLGLPRNHAVLDIHLPRAGTRAVNAVSRAHDLVMAETLTVEDVRLTPATEKDLARIGGGFTPAKVGTQREER